MSANKKSAVFFDRDDTLIHNIPYNGDPSQVALMPEAVEALWMLRERFLLFIVSNQSGVGRGYITQEQVMAVNAEMERQLGERFFTQIYNCYSAPGQHGSETRKPSPAMLQQASNAYDLDLTQSFMVGDRYVDVMAGKNAGCRSILIPTNNFASEHESAKANADFVAKNLKEAAQWILSQPKLTHSNS